MISTLLGIYLFLVALALGRPWVQLCTPDSEPDMKLACSAALGFGILSYAVVILGALKAFSSVSVQILCAAAVVPLILNAKPILTDFRASAFLWRVPRSAFIVLISLVGLVSAAAAFAGVLTPETANDSLCYHLHLPKLFLKNHSLAVIPYEINSVFPLFMENLFGIALALRPDSIFAGAVLAKFFHFMTGLIAAFAVGSFLRKRTDTATGWAGALFFLTTPGILNQFGTTYIDVGLTLYTALAVIAVVEWTESRFFGWMALAGIFAGFAASMKYLAMMSLLSIGALLLLALVLRQRSFRETLKAGIVFAACVLAVSVFWYGRAYAATGNPVYPYFYSIFKSGDPSIHYSDIGVAKNLVNFIKIPWTLTMRPELFEGFGVQIGPGYLALVPLSFAAARNLRFVAPMLGFTFAYTALWFILGQDLRFYFPALPVLAVICFAGLYQFRNGDAASRVLNLLVAVTLFIHAGLALYHYRDSLRFVLSRQSPADFLSKTERSWEPAVFVNENLGSDSKILNADETHMFYFDRAIVRESVFARETRYHEKFRGDAEIIGWIKEQGFSHILLAQSPLSDIGSMPPGRIPKMLREREKDLALFMDLIYTHSFSDSESQPFQYKLYRLKP